MPNDVNVDRLIEKAMSRLEGKVKEKDRAKVEAMLRDTFENKKLPKDAIGMTKKQLECIYSYAYNLFTHGKYNDARVIMKFLMQLDPEDPRYPMGVAAAFHQMKDYQMAASYYYISAFIDQDSPLPYYYMYDCFKNLNEPRSAFLMLEEVVKHCGDKKEHAVLRERAERTKDSLYRDMVESLTQKNVA